MTAASYVDESHVHTVDELATAFAALRTGTCPAPCPHCGTPRPSAHHYRDAGDAGPELAERTGHCPALAARRGGTR